MFASLARRTFDLYRAPARYVYKKTLRNAQVLNAVVNELKRSGVRSEVVTDQVLTHLCRQLGIDPATISREQRLHQAKTAIANAEHAISLALTEALKALLLISIDEKPINKTSSNQIIEGRFEVKTES